MPGVERGAKVEGEGVSVRGRGPSFTGAPRRAVRGGVRGGEALDAPAPTLLLLLLLLLPPPTPCGGGVSPPPADPAAAAEEGASLLLPPLLMLLLVMLEVWMAVLGEEDPP